MSGNIEKVLGGSFLAKNGFDGEIEGEDDNPEIPGINVPEKVFEKTFDPDALEKAKATAPKYKEMSGRFDPFSIEKMLLSAGTWSVLIERQVVTFQDACDHAKGLCALWRREDQELAEIAEKRADRQVKKEVASKTDILVEGTKAYEVEQARLEWKEAVRQRNKAVSDWNKYVEEKRNHYRELRDS